jgi:hypothetical protein
MQLIQDLAALARRDRYSCEDPWYSCPKAEGGCANDAAGDDCNCGAEQHNAKVEAIVNAIAQQTSTSCEGFDRK